MIDVGDIRLSTTTSDSSRSVEGSKWLGDFVVN